MTDEKERRQCIESRVYFTFLRLLPLDVPHLEFQTLFLLSPGHEIGQSEKI